MTVIELRAFGCFGLAGFEAGDLLAAGAADDQQGLGAVLDDEGAVVDVDGYGLAGVLDADADALLGEHDGAAAGHPALDSQQLGGRPWCWSGRPGAADAGELGRG